jgi:hypothetical protein
MDHLSIRDDKPLDRASMNAQLVVTTDADWNIPLLLVVMLIHDLGQMWLHTTLDLLKMMTTLDGMIIITTRHQFRNPMVYGSTIHVKINLS